MDERLSFSIPAPHFNLDKYAVRYYNECVTNHYEILRPVLAVCIIVPVAVSCQPIFTDFRIFVKIEQNRRYHYGDFVRKYHRPL